jgi:hypothetical protein
VDPHPKNNAAATNNKRGRIIGKLPLKGRRRAPKVLRLEPGRVEQRRQPSRSEGGRPHSLPGTRERRERLPVAVHLAA